MDEKRKRGRESSSRMRFKDKVTGRNTISCGLNYKVSIAAAYGRCQAESFLIGKDPGTTPSVPGGPWND